jgi:uncharacterized membrane protein
MPENKQLDAVSNGDLTQIEKELHQVDPKVFDGVNKQKKQQIVKTVVHAIQRIHVGPIPDPSTLAEYNNIIPNGAERIMAMAEKQSDHRMKMESEVIHRQMNQSNLGQVFAFIIGLAALGSATYCILQGFQWAGGFIGVGGLTSLVTAFIQGKKSQDATLAEKKPRTK